MLDDDGREGVAAWPGGRELDAVMHDAPIGMAIIDNDGRFVRVNRAACELFGRAETELVGMVWRDVTDPDDRDIGTEEIAELFAGKRERFTIEKRYVRPDGAIRWALTSVALIRDAAGDPLFRITQHVDITERKIHESELVATTSTQAAAIDDLRRLEDAKSAFLTAVSHELRTPVTVISGIAESLGRLRSGLDPEVRDRLEDALVANTKRLSALLDDLLDLDRLAVGDHALDPARIDVVGLVRRLITNSEVRARVELDVPDHLAATTDASRVALIVNNLLGNVAKYAPTGPVQVRLSPLDGGGFRLEVADHGPGVPPAERDAVFRPFHRLAVGHARPGVGIGLSLVAQFAALHGGGASIIDTDVGTHVVVELPDLRLRTTDARNHHDAHTPNGIGPHPEDVPVPVRDASTPTGQARILIVEDDPQLRAMYRAALAHAGHDVTEAADGDTAHRVLDAETFDLVLLDMELPDATGAGIASLIRADPRHTAMGIIFVSGDTALETKLAGLSAGGSDYLVKPVSLRELLGRVEAHLRDRSAWIESLERSLQKRSRLANRILALRGCPELSTLITELTEILATNFPVHDLRFKLDRDATFAITSRGDRPTIRLPLTDAQGSIGTIETITSLEHAQQAATILSDLAPHISLAAGPLLQAYIASDGARRWLEELARPDGIITAVQPIIALGDGTTVGYEALARFNDDRRPDQIIAAAWAQGIGNEVETLAIRRHIEAARHLDPGAWLALNVSGRTLASLDADLLDNVGRGIVFELTEQEPIDDYQLLRHHVAGLSRARLAVDDTGAGYSSLRHIYELRPSLVKLDRTWIAGCDTDPVRQTLIRGLVDFADSIDADIVAEGIEHDVELDTVTGLGVTFGQGFLLGRPFELGHDRPSGA